MNQPVKIALPAAPVHRGSQALAGRAAHPAVDGIDLTQRLGGLRMVTFHHHDVIYRESPNAPSVHLLVSGLVKLVTHVSDDRLRIVRLLCGGDFLGLDALVEGGHRQTAVALGEVSLYRVPVPMLLGLKTRDPAFYCRLLECWYVHLAYADTWITEFSTGPIRPRVARLLRFLSQRAGVAGMPQVRLLTCEEVAEVLGVTPESASRWLAEFKRDGLLRRASGTDPDLFFCDLAGLDAIARGGA